MLWIFAGTPALALDCTGLDAEVCDAANLAASQINQAAGQTVVSDSASLARLRTGHFYTQLLAVKNAAVAGGCVIGGDTFAGVQGGTYDRGPDTWNGVWDEVIASGQGGASGTVSPGTWDGAFTGDEAGDFGTLFALYNSAGQVAGDREGDFFVGIWRRTAGQRGVYATVWGTCPGTIADAFDGWYDGDLPDLAPPVGPPVPQPIGPSAATFSQSGFPASAAVDGNLVNNTGWAISPNIVAQTAVFETVSDTPIFPGGTETTFQLGHLFPSPSQHLLGCFQLFVTTADRSLFADGLQSGGQIGAGIWTPISVTAASASNGAVLTADGSGRILAQNLGSATATYTVAGETSLSGLTGFRLDACEDVSLPHNGPGLQPTNGNFVLTEITLATRAR